MSRGRWKVIEDNECKRLIRGSKNPLTFQRTTMENMDDHETSVHSVAR